MLNLVRVDQGNNVLEAYTENDANDGDREYPEFKVTFSDSSTPRYAILSRNDDLSYDNLSGFDTLKECTDYLQNLIDSRS